MLLTLFINSTNLSVMKVYSPPFFLLIKVLFFFLILKFSKSLNLNVPSFKQILSLSIHHSNYKPSLQSFCPETELS